MADKKLVFETEVEVHVDLINDSCDVTVDLQVEVLAQGVLEVADDSDEDLHGDGAIVPRPAVHPGPLQHDHRATQPRGHAGLAVHQERHQALLVSVAGQRGQVRSTLLSLRPLDLC